MSALPILRTVPDLRAALAPFRAEGQRIALVPTMGALHIGHLALVHLARCHADKVVMSLFVNPKQFAPHEDFDRYPRAEADDAEKAAGAGVDLLYAPDGAAMYPQGFATELRMGGPAEGLESEARPHFFHGVATVVAKLLLQALPDVAVFGEKDYQQLLVIRRLVADLDLQVEILGAPIVRETDGLALSSRNAYLSDADRARAPALARTIAEVARRAEGGEAVAEATAWGGAALREAGFDPVDYLAVRDAGDLGPADLSKGPARVLVAAKLGQTRLIDNWPVKAAAMG